MGNKMTSTPYGLKVKEHTNHADYKDVFDKTVFKIYYNESTHVWSIIANYDRLWSEGIQYNVGDTILSFTNTSNQEKTVLGQYDQEGTEVYRNIMYKIKCYQGEAGQGQTKQMIQITGGYSPKTYDKDTVCTDILHTHVSVYYNGKWHKAMYLVYDNASIAGCWMKKVGSLAITYAYPYWFLMCTKAGLKQGDRTYAARELIRSWSQDDYISMSFKEYKIRSKTKLGKGSYEKGEYLVKTIPSEDSIEVNFIVNGKIENKDTIILGFSDVPYDFYNIRIDYDTNNWSLISINGHISYNKHNYKKDAVICTLNKNEQITVTLIDNNDRYEKQQELNNDYEETVYDIVALPDSTYITVKNQTIVKEVNPETGQTEKVYIDYDEKVINQEDQMPADFYNIRFIYTSSDNKWTIYSLCDYIKYGGRTYTKNKSILSFGTDEYDPEDPHPEIHLEIKDETEKYEIESTTTYTVKSVQVSSVTYKLWTVTIDKSLKIEKTVDTIVEPWISLRYYEAMYEPVIIDDLIIEFSNVDMKWYLKSNNDNLYCAGTNYQKGKLITYWDYDYIQNLKYITVLSSSSEYGIELKKLVSGKAPYVSNDIDEIYDEGLKICHSSAKGLWEIISVDDETYYNGIQFLEGQTIVSFRDKTILDQFTILVKKIIEGEEEYDNVMYTCYTGVDLIEGITTLTINGMSWTDKSATDDNKSTIVTKDTARSMYGYIWQKEETPPPPYTGYSVFIAIKRDRSGTDINYILAVSPYENNWGVSIKSSAYSESIPIIIPGDPKYLNRMFIFNGVSLQFIDDYNDSLHTINAQNYGNNSFNFISNNLFYTVSTSNIDDCIYYKKYQLWNDGSCTNLINYTDLEQMESGDDYLFGDSCKMIGYRFPRLWYYDLDNKTSFEGCTLDNVPDILYNEYVYTIIDPTTGVWIESSILVAIVNNNAINWLYQNFITINNKHYFGSPSGSDYYKIIRFVFGQEVYIYHKIKAYKTNSSSGESEYTDLGTEVAVYDMKTGTLINIHTDFTDSEYIELYNIYSSYYAYSTIIYGDGTYYFYQYDGDNLVYNIYTFDPETAKFEKIKTIQSGFYIPINVYDLNERIGTVYVYFDNRQCTYVSDHYECGISSIQAVVGDYTGSLLDSTKFLKTVVKISGSNYNYINIVFDNPLLNISVNNFAIINASL